MLDSAASQMFLVFLQKWASTVLPGDGENSHPLSCRKLDYDYFQECF